MSGKLHALNEEVRTRVVQEMLKNGKMTIRDRTFCESTSTAAVVLMVVAVVAVLMQVEEASMLTVVVAVA